MSSIKKILVPTDFSPSSDRAMEHAVLMARAFQARILLIHVVEIFTYSVSDTLQVMDHSAALKAIAEPLLENAREKIEKAGLSIETVLLTGNPYREILDAARRSGVDMIVMGTHGRTGVEHFLMGSVAERVIRLAACPVMTVRLPA
jgi:nucleotide-binding universal stress UspA family protein